MSDPLPAAVERAQSLIRHVKHLGGALEAFCVTVTKAEAYELIEWFRGESAELAVDRDLLDLDIQHARKIDDPWYVLKHFTVLGLPIAPREELH